MVYVSDLHSRCTATEPHGDAEIAGHRPEMSSSEVLASSSTAGTPDDGRCVATRQSDGERCTKNVSERWAEFGRYCPTLTLTVFMTIKNVRGALLRRPRRADAMRQTVQFAFSSMVRLR